MYEKCGDKALQLANIFTSLQELVVAHGVKFRQRLNGKSGELYIYV